MSALPLKADKQEKVRLVRFVPKADIRIAAKQHRLLEARLEQRTDPRCDVIGCTGDAEGENHLVAHGTHCP